MPHYQFLINVALPLLSQSVLFSNAGGSCSLIYDPKGEAKPNKDGTDPTDPMMGTGENFEFPDLDNPISINKRTVQQWVIGNAGVLPVLL